LYVIYFFGGEGVDINQERERKQILIKNRNESISPGKETDRRKGHDRQPMVFFGRRRCVTRAGNILPKREAGKGNKNTL
jgi:hypothetical protein